MRLHYYFYLTQRNPSPVNAICVFFVVPLVIAGATLPRRFILIFMGIIYAVLILLAFLVHTSDPISESVKVGSIVLQAILLLVIDLISYLNAWSTDGALEDAQQARNQAMSASRALEEANNLLEQRVTERTQSMQFALSELSESLNQQQHLNQTITELSVPIIPVLEGVLVVPFIGSLDAKRTQTFMEHILVSIETINARVVFIDLTGAALVDTQTAQLLLSTTTAAKLLGAETILVGMRPEVAQSLVGLGADLNSIRTTASLHTGLAMLLEQRNGVGRIH